MRLKPRVKRLEQQRVYPFEVSAEIIDAERASREAIQRKCEKLEEIVEVQTPLNPNYADVRSFEWKIQT